MTGTLRRLIGISFAGLVATAPVTFATADEAIQPSAIYNWSGGYLGAHVGGLANFSQVTDPLGPSLFGNPNLAAGPFAGLQAGYNFQSGAIVYGVEADVSLPEVRGTSTCSALSGSFINSNCQAGIDAFGTLTGRLGFALGDDGRSLIYGKAGAAWQSGSLDIATNDSTRGGAGNPYTHNSNGISSWGWTLGAGAEYALAGNWSVAAEYDYANFGKSGVSLLPSAVLDSTGAVSSLVAGREGHISSELHEFKLGLNYHFGGGEAEAPTASVPAASTSPYGLEIGGRYWLSWGRYKYDLGLLKSDPVVSYSLISRLTYDDLEASTGEFAGRFTAPWNLFAKGFIGGGSIGGGHMNDEDYNIPGDAPGVQVPYTNTLSPEVSGDVPTYGTIDVGYDWWRTARYRVGTYVGYNYYRETMGAYGVYQTANPLGPFGSGGLPPTGHAIISQEATWQSVRLGAATDFYLTPRLKLSADAAYLPYVTVNAEDVHYFGNTPSVASVNPFDGYGVGAQVEAMLSYDVTGQISIGLGARYWSMWTTDAAFRRTFDATAPVTFPIRHQNSKLETERAGLLAQLIYKFY
jgi:opacity protein-like surface antigen/outer membrane protease